MPKQIPLSEKREWLKEYEEGNPEAKVAKERHRALKVIKRGIQEARANRDGSAARAEIVKEALIRHQKQLFEIVNRLLNLTNTIPANFKLRREKNGAIAPIILSAGLIVYSPEKGLVTKLSDENTSEWGLLKEHLKQRRIWSILEQWKTALIANTKALLDFERGIKTLVEIETGLQVISDKPGDEQKGFIYPFTAELFSEVSIRKAVGISDETNPDKRMVTTEDGYILHGQAGSRLAYCLGRQDECREALVRAFEKIQDLKERLIVVSTDAELKNVSAKLKGPLDDIRLMGLIPGQCRICSRISL